MGYRPVARWFLGCCFVVADDLRVGMRTLSPAQEEVLRKRIMAAVLREGMADKAAVALFGVSSKSIRAWRARYEAAGEAGLRSGRTGGKLGQGRKTHSRGGAVR